VIFIFAYQSKILTKKMDVFAKQLLKTENVPFWMNIKTLHCLYLASKFSNYVVCYNKCFHMNMDGDIERLIEETKDLLFAGQSPHSPPFWVPSFCALFPPIIHQCLSVIETGPESAWMKGEDGETVDEERRKMLLAQECERNISPLFLKFCKQCWYEPLVSDCREEELLERELVDVSSLENIDALATSLKSEDFEEKGKRAKVARNNFRRRMAILRLDEISVWMLLYWVIHMKDEDYDRFMNYICGGIPIFTDKQVQKIESYRKVNIKDTKLEGTMDALVLSFMLVFCKV